MARLSLLLQCQVKEVENISFFMIFFQLKRPPRRHVFDETIKSEWSERHTLSRQSSVADSK